MQLECECVQPIEFTVVSSDDFDYFFDDKLITYQMDEFTRVIENMKWGRFQADVAEALGID